MCTSQTVTQYSVTVYSCFFRFQFPFRSCTRTKANRLSLSVIIFIQTTACCSFRIHKHTHLLFQLRTMPNETRNEMRTGMRCENSAQEADLSRCFLLGCANAIKSYDFHRLLFVVRENCSAKPTSTATTTTIYTVVLVVVVMRPTCKWTGGKTMRYVNETALSLLTEYCYVG